MGLNDLMNIGLTYNWWAWAFAPRWCSFVECKYLLSAIEQKKEPLKVEFIVAEKILSWFFINKFDAPFIWLACNHASSSHTFMLIYGHNCRITIPLSRHSTWSESTCDAKMWRIFTHIWLGCARAVRAFFLFIWLNSSESVICIISFPFLCHCQFVLLHFVFFVIPTRRLLFTLLSESDSLTSLFPMRLL